MTTAQHETQGTTRGGAFQTPLAYLEVGQKVETTLKEVRKSKNKDEYGYIKNFYDVVLLQDLTIKDKDKKDIVCKAGDVVTIPGTKGIDNNMAAFARAVGKLPEDKDFLWSLLYGHKFVFERELDSKNKRVMKITHFPLKAR